MKTPLLFFLGLASLVTASADHNREREDDTEHDRDRWREEPRVIVFEHAGFKGDFLVLYPGDAIENMSGMTFERGVRLNDSISSIVVEGDAELYVYENARYRGQAMRVTENIRDLGGRLLPGTFEASWNDRISSLKVGRSWGRDRGDDGDYDKRPRIDPEKVIKASFKDLLGRDPDPGEFRDFLARFLDQGWNDRMLRDYLRDEERYRIEAADRLIKRAYLDVLGREPDPSGLRTYRKNLLKRQWTEGDVRDSLRKSAEYRDTHH